MNRNYFQEPNALFMIIVVVVYSVGTTLSFMAMTDLFTQNPFTSENRIMLAIQLAAFWVTAKVVYNYFKYLKQKQQPSTFFIKPKQEDDKR